MYKYTNDQLYEIFDAYHEITNEDMIDIFDMKTYMFDFMGYVFTSVKNLSYHHLIIPDRFNGPQILDNGAELNKKTSHPYLHTIEWKDPELFSLITIQMILQNRKRKLDLENIRKIRDYLEYFEKEHSSDTCKKGKPLIKTRYLSQRIPLNTSTYYSYSKDNTSNSGLILL